MDRTLRLGFSLEFYSVPSPFRDRFPHCGDLGPTAETGCVRPPAAQQGKGVLLRLLPGSKEDRGVKTQFGSVSFKQVHCLQNVSHANHQAVAGTALAGRLTTIDLNDTYFHVEVAPKLRKFLHFAFRWVAYEYNRLQFGYSLAPRTLSKCVDVALQPLHDQGMRVVFYLDNHIVMTEEKGCAVFHTLAGICNQLADAQPLIPPTGGAFGVVCRTCNLVHHGLHGCVPARVGRNLLGEGGSRFVATLGVAVHPGSGEQASQPHVHVF